MPFVYILKCRGGTYYTGYAKDLDARIPQHQSGKGAKYTRGRLPVELIYSEECPSIGEALRRENEIKKMSRTQKAELIRNQSDRQ